MKVAELQLNQGIRPLKPTSQPTKPKSEQNKVSSVGFGSLLQQKLQQTEGLKFSAHAIKRLENRALELSEFDLQRLQQGVQQLQAKGARNSVILMDNRAFVVSVTNKTVVTAIDQGRNAQKIFTNIDSLAIV